MNKFILAASPWWGGFYERLVRSIKLPMKKVLGKARLTYEEMETALIDVEGIINNRPLTFLYDDDVTEPLTSSHLLTGRNLSLKCNEKVQTSVIPAGNLRNRAKYLQCILEMFWNRFRTGYLSELREHHMYWSNRMKTNDENLLKIGDVVIIKDDKVIPRSSWRSGRVDSLIIGEDGKIRDAVLFTISKEGKRTKLTRPLQKIIPLETVEYKSNPSDNTMKTHNATGDEHVISLLPTFTDHTNKNSSVLDDSTIMTRRSDIFDTDDIPRPYLRPKRVAATTGELIRRLQAKD